MKAFFADVQETGLVPDRGSKAWGAQLALPSEEQKRALAEIDNKLIAAKAHLNEEAAKLPASQPQWEENLKRRWQSGDGC